LLTTEAIGLFSINPITEAVGKSDVEIAIWFSMLEFCSRSIRISYSRFMVKGKRRASR
jgi:hypothetical protein